MNYYNATSGTTGATTIVQLPLAFVRSGYVDLGASQARVIGTNGYSWTRTSNSANDTYSLYFSSSIIYPSNYGNRYYGRPLRCRTRTSEEKSKDEK